MFEKCLKFLPAAWMPCSLLWSAMSRMHRREAKGVSNEFRTSALGRNIFEIFLDTCKHCLALFNKKGWTEDNEQNVSVSSPSICQARFPCSDNQKAWKTTAARGCGVSLGASKSWQSSATTPGMHLENEHHQTSQSVKVWLFHRKQHETIKQNGSELVRIAR